MGYKRLTIRVSSFTVCIRNAKRVLYFKKKFVMAGSTVVGCKLQMSACRIDSGSRVHLPRQCTDYCRRQTTTFLQLFISKM